MADPICLNCKQPFPVGLAKCPNCGGTARTHSVNVDIKASTNVTLRTTLTQIRLEKNLPLIALYVAMSVAFSAGTSQLSGWSSFGVSVIGDLITTWVGIYMAVKVIRETNS